MVQAISIISRGCRRAFIRCAAGGTYPAEGGVKKVSEDDDIEIGDANVDDMRGGASRGR